ncbi:MAG: PEP-CTERM sorting domain-containing protein [Phycisphaerales bacterium]|nr:PEP-CTERM sorting domain-containing protein [Phycisphaerales bacterium]
MNIRSLCAIAAATTSLASIGSSQAAIVYSGALNVAVPVGTGLRVWIDLDTFATSTTGSFTGWDVSLTGTTANFLTVNSQSLSNNLFVGIAGTPVTINRLAPGFVIGSTGPYGTIGGGTMGSSFNMGTFLPNSENIVGFRRDIGGGQFRYGWLSVTLGNDFLTRSLTGIAFEDSGGSIVAGAIPAPGAVALLGLGGALSGRRQRRMR